MRTHIPHLGRHLEKMLLHLSATKRKGANHGCSSLRQEAGPGRSCRSNPHRGVLTVPTLQCPLERGTTLGGKPEATSPGDTRKSQHLPAPALGDVARESLPRAQPSMGVPQECYQPGCAWSRITCSRITTARAQGHLHNMQLVANYNLIFKTQF